jgi:hypothetical protein
MRSKVWYEHAEKIGCRAFIQSDRSSPTIAFVAENGAITKNNKDTYV